MDKAKAQLNKVMKSEKVFSKMLFSVIPNKIPSVDFDQFNLIIYLTEALSDIKTYIDDIRPSLNRSLLDLRNLTHY